MKPFPRPRQFVVRVLRFPLTEPSAVRRFTTNRRVGLGVMAEFVVEHVVEKDPCDPWLGELWIDHNRWLGTGAVTSKADGGQPPPWAVATPANHGTGQVRKPGAVDLGKYGLQVKPVREGFQHRQIYRNRNDLTLTLLTPDILQRLTQTRGCAPTVAGDPLRQFTERLRMIQ